jgi:hypothetical protein
MSTPIPPPEASVAAAMEFASTPKVVRDVVKVASAESPTIATQEHLVRTTADTTEATLTKTAKPENHAKKMGEVNEQVNTKRNPDTFAKENDPTYDAQRTKAEALTANLNEYLQKGYDGLTDTIDPLTKRVTQTVADKQKKLRDTVLSHLNGREEFKSLLAKDKPDDVAVKILKDPRFMENLDRQFTQAMDTAGNRFAETDPQDVLHTKKGAELGQTMADAQTKAAEAEQKRIDNRLKEFDAGGSEAKRIDDLTAELKKLAPQKAVYDSTIATLQQQVNTNERTVRDKTMPANVRKDANDAIIRLQKEISDKMDEPDYITIQTDSYELQALQDELQKLQANKTTVDNRVLECKQKSNDSATNFRKADEAATENKNARTDAVNDYVSDLENAVTAATESFADKQLIETMDKLKAQRPAAEAQLANIAGQREAEIAHQLTDQLEETTLETRFYNKDKNGKDKKDHWYSWQKNTEVQVSRWDEETIESSLRREKYRKAGRPEPQPEMKPIADKIEDDYNRMLNDKDFIKNTVSSMQFDGKPFSSLSVDDQNRVCRSFARELINRRTDLF